LVSGAWLNAYNSKILVLLCPILSAHVLAMRSSD
jgi:hypothetical protein